jgi:hypothetical protein
LADFAQVSSFQLSSTTITGKVAEKNFRLKIQQSPNYCNGFWLFSQVFTAARGEQYMNGVVRQSVPEKCEGNCKVCEVCAVWRQQSATRMSQVFIRNR